VKHIVGFSGGIDSQAVAGLVIDEYGKDTILLNSNAGGNEDPLTDLFVEWYSVNVYPVVRVNAIVADLWKTPNYLDVAKTKETAVAKAVADIRDDHDALTFAGMIRFKRRPPSRTNQFCTEILKLRPQKRWIAEHFGVGGQFEGESYVRYTGLRRDESENRKNTPNQEFDEFFDCEVFHLIAEWTKDRCFEFVKNRGEKINPLYMLGFNRVGCAPCVNCSKEDILNWLERRPEMIEKVREMERETGYSYFPPIVPGSHHNRIDEVLAWAKTTRGGKQFALPRQRPACESKYGLCE
jgi:3'-phosphoadenosine 5'-phosphosulfate sulfotransferase (PAPS reductase)/FAD synthetase